MADLNPVRASIGLEEFIDGKWVSAADMFITTKNLSASDVTEWATSSLHQLSMVANVAQAGELDDEEDGPVIPASYTVRLTACPDAQHDELLVGAVAKITGKPEAEVCNIPGLIRGCDAKYVLKKDATAEEALSLTEWFGSLGATVEIA